MPQPSSKSLTGFEPSAADLAACRTLLRGGSRTFYAASFLLPRRVREPALSLYAFCRLADDAVDSAGAGPAALAALHERLARAYDGCPADSAADRAFAAVVRRFAIPRALPEALLEGFAWDAAGRRYRRIEDLHAYGARVAGTVGAMMALLMGARSPAQLARACDLGVAMQLSNIARDVGEDAAAGRLYLPLEWLAEAGLDADAFVARPRPCPRLGAVVRRLLAEADRLYARSMAGIARLPGDCRTGIHAARLLYAAIGHEVARRGCDPVSARAVVAPARKAALLARAPLAAAMPAPPGRAAPLAATRFLVDAVACMPAPVEPSPARGIEQRVVWTLELFARLEQRQQLARAET